MVWEKTLKAIEYDKIMFEVSKSAVLKATKDYFQLFMPLTTFSEVDNLLKQTDEAYQYLYRYGTGGIYYFDDVSDELKRVDIGSALNNAELLKVASNLKSARLIKTAIASVNDLNLTLIKGITERLFINPDFEKEIADKIISEDEVSDNASPKLYSIRKSITNINARIRAELNSYMLGGLINIFKIALLQCVKIDTLFQLKVSLEVLLKALFTINRHQVQRCLLSLNT